VDGSGVIRFCNAAAEAILGRPAADLVGSEIGLFSGGTVEVDVMLPGGEVRVVEMSVTATTLDGDPISVVALYDMTQTRHDERALAVALERQHVVVGVAAHELRNPLAAIGGLANVLQESWVDLSDAAKLALVQRIAERTTRLQILVDKLLRASRLDAGAAGAAPEAVPVLELILEELAEHARPEEDLRASCPPRPRRHRRPGRAAGDAGQLPGERPTLRPSPIEVRAAELGTEIEVRVCDRGPGVPDDFIPRLFDRFSRAPQAERNVEGSGLGLWIVRGLARANGGDAWYVPHPGGGACFCLRIPSGSA